MWLAHYGFHFLTGGLTVVPVIQSFLADVGLFGGRVQWGLGALAPTEWLFPIEAVLLYLGAFGSVIAAFQIARDRTPADEPEACRAILGAALPWILVVLLCWASGSGSCSSRWRCAARCRWSPERGDDYDNVNFQE